MEKEAQDSIEVEGYVTALLPNTMFRVKLDMGGEILAHLSGKMRIRYIKLTVGDRVKVEISKYDTQKGRITYRLSERTVFNKPSNKYKRK
ncbi:translation initiation factor IF-1 [Elusimicrobiota bacterium]